MSDEHLLTAKDREIDVLIRARYPLIYIISPEEDRVEHGLRRIVNGRKLVQAWSATQPFGAVDPQGNLLSNQHDISTNGYDMALQALDFIARRVREDVHAVYLLRDFDPYLDNPVVVRRLRDLAHHLKRSHCTVVFLSPVLQIPPYLEKEIVVVDYDMPSFAELAVILEELVRRVSGDPRIEIDLDEPHREALVKAALGLTADEAENAFAKALVQNGRLDEVDIKVVLAEKKQIIRKTGMLDFYEATGKMDDVGGLNSLKKWLDKRGSAFSEKAREFGLPGPKGILLLGVPGCGKSLTAKAIGESWHLPLLRFDIGRVFGKFVGESEANMRNALKAAEAVAPCILWVDEIEKALSGTRGDDGGVSMRILGGFLSWLQDKSAPVFVVATANNVDNLPPELLRKGRLDEMFFVDLPRAEERADIFAIHLERHGRDKSTFDLQTLAQRSEGYSGAEIEQSIISALYDAFDGGREVTTEDIVHNLSNTVPLSVTMSEEVAQLRKWASTRTRPAS